MLATSAVTKKELRKASTLALAVALIFTPSYIADIGMRRLNLDIGVAAAISLALFLVGVFLLIKLTKD